MAHFARLDPDKKVIEVLVIGNDDIKDESGNEVEQLGIDFLEVLTGESSWVQTSYNNSFRKRYASIGYTYDSTRDVFIEPQPYPSFTLSEETYSWQPPVPYPEDEIYIDENGEEKLQAQTCIWDEINLGWVCDNGMHPPLTTE